jgi:hypothetical protein
MSVSHLADSDQKQLHPSADHRAPPPPRPRTGKPLLTPAVQRPVLQPLWLRATIILALAAAYTALIVHYSLQHGRLILFLTYDDVSYIQDGLSRLQTFYNAGPATVLKMYAVHPPHAPWSSFLALVAFAIFGVHDWAPYAANGILIVGYFAFADYLLRGVPLWQKLVCFALLVSIPLLAGAVAEFRADHASNLLLAIGLLLLLRRPLASAPRRYLALAGAFVGLAIAGRPHMFIAAGLLTAAALVLATACDRFGEGLRPTRTQVAGAWATCLVPFILIPLPHFLVGWREVIGYIYDNVFGRYRTIWQTKGTLGFHLSYYLWGEGAHAAFGGTINPHAGPPIGIPSHLLLIAIILCAAIVRLLLRARRRELVRAAAIGLLLLGSYLISALMKNKSVFFGLGFQTLLLFVAVIALRDLLLGERLGRLRRPWRWRRVPLLGGRLPLAAGGLVCLAAIGVAAWGWPPRYGDRGEDSILNRRQIVDGIYRDIRDNTDYAAPVVFVTAPGDANDRLLGYMAMKEGRTMYPYALLDHSDDPVYVEAEFNKAHFVVASDAGSGLIADFLPEYTIQNHLVQVLAGRRDYALVGRYIYAPAGRGFYLFEHVGAFFGWRPLSGFGTMEGPFPESHMPNVRWSYGPSATLRMTAHDPGHYVLTWRARNVFPGQAVTVSVDGREIARRPLEPSDAFVSHQVPFDVPAGDHVLQFTFSQWERVLPRPMAILFSELRIERAR